MKFSESQNLRHPKKCKIFRDYNWCKFGEWCFFTHESIENKEILDDIVMNLNVKYGFTTNSEQGLRIHTKRKHTENTEDTILKICNLCEKNF